MQGATLLHLGGLLPPHLGYHPARKLVTHDWLWSVGAHPQSFTSVGEWLGGWVGQGVGELGVRVRRITTT